jgi:hypothetical protein
MRIKVMANKKEKELFITKAVLPFIHYPHLHEGSRDFHVNLETNQRSLIGQFFAIQHITTLNNLSVKSIIDAFVTADALMIVSATNVLSSNAWLMLEQLSDLLPIKKDNGYQISQHIIAMEEALNLNLNDLKVEVYKIRDSFNF